MTQPFTSISSYCLQLHPAPPNLTLLTFKLLPHLPVQEAARFEEAISDLEHSLALAEGELARSTLKQRALELQVRAG